MKRGRLLSPEEINLGDEVLVVPIGTVARGVGLGDLAADGSLQRYSEALHGAARRGAVEIYESAEVAAEREKAEAASAAEQARRAAVRARFEERERLEREAAEPAAEEKESEPAPADTTQPEEH